jgi:hypothetical protein
MKILGVLRAAWNILNVRVLNVINLHIMTKHLNTKNSEKQSQSIKFYKVDYVRGLWLFVKLMKQSMGS